MTTFGRNAAGADGIKLSKHGPVKEFKANLGVVVTVSDQEEFRRQYASTVKAVCDRHNLPWKRPYCRAADLRYFSGSDVVTARIIEDIAKQVNPQIKQVHVIYTMIFPSAAPKVYIYIDDPPVVPKNPVDFQDSLEHPYPYLCLWAYSQSLRDLKCSLASDHFEGEITSAWEELKQCQLQIFFDGGNTDATISFADLLIRLLDQRFGQEILPDILDDTKLPSFLPEFEDRLRTFYLGQKYLKKIVPLQRQRINLAPYVVHPLLFIVKEPTSVQTTDFISRSRVMDKMYQVAVQLGGSVKFYDNRDQPLIQPGDYFLWVGEHGKRFVESLPKLGYRDLNIGEAEKIDEIAGK